MFVNYFFICLKMKLKEFFSIEFELDEFKAFLD